MNTETYRQLGDDSAAEAFAGITQKAAEAVIRRQLENLTAKGQVLILSDEEERLLASFRRYKASCKPGGIFKWQTRPADGLVCEAPDIALITDPQDVS